MVRSAGCSVRTTPGARRRRAARALCLRGVKRLLASTCAVLAATLVAFVALGELGLRLAGYSAPIWYQADRRLGWSLRPNTAGWFTKEGRSYVQINPDGFRDRVHAPGKPAGVYRVAVVGDSAVEGFQVKLEATFWAQLPQRLRGCPALRGAEAEVMAFGVSGFGTAQQYLMLESAAMRYRPDLVLLAFAANDLRNNSLALEPDKLRPFFVLKGQDLELDASFAQQARFVDYAKPWAATYRTASDWLLLVQLVNAARHGIQTWRAVSAAHAQALRAGENIPGIEPTTPIALFAPPRSAAWEEAWTVTERLIARMDRYAARHDARLVVAPITHSAQVHPDAATRKNLQDALGVPDLFYIERRLEALGSREGIPVVPLAPELQKRADARGTYFHGFDNYQLGWGHWNEQGHAAAAEILAARLCSRL